MTEIKGYVRHIQGNIHTYHRKRPWWWLFILLSWDQLWSRRR